MTQILSLAPDCCCVRVVSRDGDRFETYFGEAVPHSISPFKTEYGDPSRTNWNKAGKLSMACWKARWILVASPHGRVHVYEFTYDRIALLSTVECPVNTSAVLIVGDEASGSDSALVVFGTDEGETSSIVLIARVHFTSESLSVKYIKTWKCPSGVADLAHLQGDVFVSYSTTNGVGCFNLDRAISTLDESQGLIENVISGQGSIPTPYLLTTRDPDMIFTLTSCGTLRCYQSEEYGEPYRKFALGFNVLGVKPLNKNELLVCGWQGEAALIGIMDGNVANFMRSRETARVDDFGIMVTNQKTFLLQSDADNGMLKFFDLRRTALLGSSHSEHCTASEHDVDGDDLEYITSFEYAADTGRPVEDAKPVQFTQQDEDYIKQAMTLAFQVLLQEESD